MKISNVFLLYKANKRIHTILRHSQCVKPMQNNQLWTIEVCCHLLVDNIYLDSPICSEISDHEDNFSLNSQFKVSES